MSGPPAVPAVPPVPVVWRPRFGRLVPYVLMPVVIGCLVAVGLAMAASVRLVDMGVFAVLGALVLTGLYLLGRPRVAAHQGGLTVVNILGRRHLEWAEIIWAAMPDGEPWPTLDLADGTTLATMGIQAADGSRAARQLAEMQALLHDRGTAAESD